MNVIAIRREAIVMFRLGHRSADVAFTLKVRRCLVSQWRAEWRPGKNGYLNVKPPVDGRTVRDAKPEPTPEEFAIRLAEVQAARTTQDWSAT